MTGNIGTPGAPVTINIKSDIQTLQAAAVHANITVGTNNGSGVIRRLKATTGDITGSISAKSILPNTPTNPDDGITVAGDLVAPLTVSSYITRPLTVGGDVVGSITARGLTVNGNSQGDVFIGDRLLGDITLTDAAKLNTQAIINQNGNTYSPWVTPWAGTISVGGVALSPKGNYTQNPQTVGAGAVGLAPYTFQWAECDPVHTHSKHLTLQNPVYIKHYGPVERTYSTTASCYTVEFSNDGGQNWTIVSSSFEADPSGSSGRTIAVRPKAPYYWQAGRYRFTPIGGIQIQTPQPYIRCKLVDGEPAVMAYSYWFDSN